MKGRKTLRRIAIALALSTLAFIGVTPATASDVDPTSTGQTCNEAGPVTPATLTIPDVEGASYSIVHEGIARPAEPGTRNVTPGEYVITATADRDVTEWKLTIVTAKCASAGSTTTLPETGMASASLAGIAVAVFVALGTIAAMGYRRARYPRSRA